MNVGRILLALVSLGAPLGMAAQSQLAELSFASETSPSMGDVRKALDSLVLDDAKAWAALAQPKVTAVQAPKPDDVIAMDPYIVSNHGIPTVTFPVFETALYRFVKTGTIVQSLVDIDGFKTEMRVFPLGETNRAGGGRVSLAFNFAW